MSNQEQLEKIKTAPGFIAALDQSGGSTPKALGLYGVTPDAWSNDEEMFDVVHQMRTRIMTSPVFNGDRILGAILFENTMDREVEGQSTASYLWNVKQVVPFLKVDKGLAEVENGGQIMNPNPGLPELLEKAKAAGIFGTKMRSVIKEANAAGVQAVVDQQFEVGRQIVAAGLVPIIEPEVDIHCPDKEAAEDIRDLERDEKRVHHRLGTKETGKNDVPHQPQNAGQECHAADHRGLQHELESSDFFARHTAGILTVIQVIDKRGRAANNTRLSEHQTR